MTSQETWLLVSGSPSSEELAALVVVLSSVRAGADRQQPAGLAAWTPPAPASAVQAGSWRKPR